MTLPTIYASTSSDRVAQNYTVYEYYDEYVYPSGLVLEDDDDVLNRQYRDDLTRRRIYFLDEMLMTFILACLHDGILKAWLCAPDKEPTELVVFREVAAE